MIKYIYYAITVLVACVFVGAVVFLYHNFYLTLAGAQEVESLVARVSIVSFDVNKVEDVAAAIQEKGSIDPPVTINDPFDHK